MMKVVETSEKIERLDMVERLSLSNKSTKVHLMIKNLVTEDAAQFKLLAKSLNLTHHQTLGLLMASFAEKHPQFINQLTNQVVTLRTVVTTTHVAYDPEIDKKIARAKADIESGQLSKEGFEPRIESLRKALKRNDIPPEQKNEIVSFIDWARTQNLPSKWETMKI